MQNKMQKVVLSALIALIGIAHEAAWASALSLIDGSHYPDINKFEKSYGYGTTLSKLMILPTPTGKAEFFVKSSSPIQVINTIIATPLFKELLGDELVPDIAIISTEEFYENECPGDNYYKDARVRKYLVASKKFNDLGFSDGRRYEANPTPCFCQGVYGSGWTIGARDLLIAEHPVYQGTEVGAIVSMILQDVDAFNNCGNHAYRKFGDGYKLVRIDLDHADLLFAPDKKNPIYTVQNQFTDIGKKFIKKLREEKELILELLYRRLEESFKLLRILYTDREIQLIYKQCAGRFITSPEDVTYYYQVPVGAGPLVLGLDDLHMRIKSNLKDIFNNI